MTYEQVDVPAPPQGQGQFSAFLVPGHIKAKAQLLDDATWGYAQGEYGGRGAPHSEFQQNTRTESHPAGVLCAVVLPPALCSSCRAFNGRAGLT